jgi:glycosyltransferase involved in cell wall biosynthesis
MGVTVSVLVPWRTDHGPRERAWNYLRPLWEATGHEIVVGTDNGHGPFNKSQAINRAFAASTGDVVVVMDADGLPPLPEFDPAPPWQPLYTHTQYLSRADTAAVYAGADPWTVEPERTYPECTSIVAVRRDAWPGMDERFEGWGYEDTALRVTLTRRHGPAAAPARSFRCLWHPSALAASPAATARNRMLFDREYAPLVAG